MSKEDIIPVYMIGIRRNDYRGVYGITHNLNEALDLLSFLSKRRAQDIDESLVDRDPWLVGEEMLIEKYEEMTVEKYLHTNCDNVCRGDAELLAKEHGFTLEEIDWHHW